MSNRADRRRSARDVAKVIAISPAVRQATEHLAKARRQGLKKTSSDEATVTDAVRNAQAQGYAAVDFIIENNDSQVVIKFDRPIAVLVLSPDKATKVMAALELARDEVLAKKKLANATQPAPPVTK